MSRKKLVGAVADLAADLLASTPVPLDRDQAVDLALALVSAGWTKKAPSKGPSAPAADLTPPEGHCRKCGERLERDEARKLRWHCPNVSCRSKVPRAPVGGRRLEGPVVMGSFDLFEQVVDGALQDAWLLVVRAGEGGAFADVGLTNLYPGGVWWDAHHDPRFDRRAAIAVVRERSEALTGASAALVDEVLRRLWNWAPRSKSESEGAAK